MHIHIQDKERGSGKEYLLFLSINAWCFTLHVFFICLLINTHVLIIIICDLIDPALKIQQFMYLLSHTTDTIYPNVCWVLIRLRHTALSLLHRRRHCDNPVSILYNSFNFTQNASPTIWIEHSLLKANNSNNKMMPNVDDDKAYPYECFPF